MIGWQYGESYQLHILDKPKEMTWVEDLQRTIWSGDNTEIVPGHLMLTAVHNGGLIIGAFDLKGNNLESNLGESIEFSGESLVGFVFSFPGFQHASGKIKLKHCSHMLGVHPQHRNSGIGFALKRAQWQMVRHLDIDWITWTYDPLLSRNAHLNIHRLGAVCNRYLPNYYGELRDELNLGQQTDRFQVDWWLNSARVERRLSKKPRTKLDLAHYLAANVKILNPTHLDGEGLPQPGNLSDKRLQQSTEQDQILLIEIPAEFQSMQTLNQQLTRLWREHTREIFTTLFTAGYLVTDFIHLPGSYPRSFYVLSHGESIL